MENINKLLLKISNVDNKYKENLIKIARDKIFEDNEDLFDLVLSQTSIHSQNVIYGAIKNGVSKDVLFQLICYSNDYKKQQRILKYLNYKQIMDNELILIDMLNIDNDYVEDKLFNCFKNNEINNLDDYTQYKLRFKTFYRVKNIIMSNKAEKLSAEDYYALKEKRILKDNVLDKSKQILRNYGFLGIDIPRTNNQNQNKNNILNSFNKDDYQKLFNIDDFGEEKLLVNGIITNSKSTLNFAEIVLIMKKILANYKLTNYTINTFDKHIYDVITKYINGNIKLIPGEFQIIKISSESEKEIVSASKIGNDIFFNLNIDKLVDYIVEEKKENLVEEKNERISLLYVTKENENNRKIFNQLFDIYQSKYNSIIVYEDDVPRDSLYTYCVENNLKFIGFFDSKNEYCFKSVDELLKKNNSKKLILNNVESEKKYE